MLTLIIFLLVLSVLVFVHEFGHFICAKRAKLRVDEFGFGFPPRVVGIRKKAVILRSEATKDLVHKSARFFTSLRMTNYEIVWGNPKNFDARAGGTVYSINALPFGGFVKIKGEGGEDDKDADSFANRKASTRVIIIAAGVVMNFILAGVLIGTGYAIGFPQALDQGGISKYAHVENPHVEIVGLLPNGPAEKAGLTPGVTVIAINGRQTKSTDDFKTMVAELVEKPVDFTIKEDGRVRDLTVTPTLLKLKDGMRPGIGVAIADIANVRYPIWLAIPKGFETAGILAKEIVFAFGTLIHDAVLGKPVAADLAGPVGIAVLTGQAARMGIIALLQFMAILSVNLAVLNIIPFPALDGGRILFILIEKILRRPVSKKVEGWIHNVGFIILITLVLFVTYKDLGRYGGRIIDFFKGLVS